MTSRSRAAVTVLMPVYDGFPFLPEAIGSIRRQSFQGWRMVIVDDGSTDGSAEYLDGLEDPRIRVVHQENRGPGAALNRGLELCETEFVARMDADDVAFPHRVASQVGWLRAHPDVGLLGTQIERRGRVRSDGGSHLPLTHDDIEDALFAGRHALCHATVVCRTEVLRALGGYWERRGGEEWDLFLRLGEVSRLANLDRVLQSVRFHPSSFSVRTLEAQRLGIVYAIECARRRRAGASPISYEDYLEARRTRPWWRRAREATVTRALLHYRKGLVHFLGHRPILGGAHLALASLHAPDWAARRVWRAAMGRGPAAGDPSARPAREDLR